MFTNYNATVHPMATTSMMQYYDFESLNEILESGGLILYPTDTVWAIGCDALNEAAIQRVYQLKRRNAQKPLTLLADGMPMLKNYVEHIHPRVETLLMHHSRPLTMVYDKGVNLPDQVLGQDGSVAFRIPADNFCKALIQSFGRPLVATAACLEGEEAPVNFGSISSAIIMGVDSVVKYRQKERNIGEPSVVARLTDRAELMFIRE